MPSSHRMLYVVTWLSEFCAFLLMFAVSRSMAEAKMSLLGLGLAGGSVALLVVLASVIAGPLSDRIGRRRVVLAGQVLLMASIAGCVATDVNDMLRYVSYSLAGAAMGMVYPALYAWLSSAANNHHARGVGRTVVVFALMWNLGMISGQLAGGWLFQWSAYWPMYLAFFVVLVNFVVVVLIKGKLGPPVTVERDEGARKRIADQKLAMSFAKLAWLANLGGAFAMSMVLNLMPSLVVNLGIAPNLHGLMLGATRGFVIVTYFVMHLSRFWHMRLFPAIGAQVIGAGGMVVISYATNAPTLMVGLLASAQLVGFNYFASLYYTTSGSAQERRGAATSFHEATLSSGFAGGAILGGLVGRIGNVGAPYRLAAGVIIILAVIQVVIYLSQVKLLRQRVQMRRRSS